MIEKFPIPFQINGTVYHSCDIESPTAGVLADTKKNADTGDKFSPTLIFLAGCIKSIISDCSEINDRLQVKSAIRHMPYRTAEVLSLKAILKASGLIRVIHRGHGNAGTAITKGG